MTESCEVRSSGVDEPPSEPIDRPSLERGTHAPATRRQHRHCRDGIVLPPSVASNHASHSWTRGCFPHPRATMASRARAVSCAIGLVAPWPNQPALARRGLEQSLGRRVQPRILRIGAPLHRGQEPPPGPAVRRPRGEVRRPLAIRMQLGEQTRHRFGGVGAASGPASPRGCPTDVRPAPPAPASGDSVASDRAANRGNRPAAPPIPGCRLWCSWLPYLYR